MQENCPKSKRILRDVRFASERNVGNTLKESKLKCGRNCSEVPSRSAKRKVAPEAKLSLHDGAVSVMNFIDVIFKGLAPLRFRRMVTQNVDNRQ